MLPLDQHLSVPHNTALETFATTLMEHPQSSLIDYFGSTWTFTEVDRDSDALARVFASRGIVKGDRIALFTQNDPIFIIGLIATWKVGAIGVPINPMNTARELSYQLEDSGAKALITLPGLWSLVANDVVADGIGEVELVVISPHEEWRLGDGKVEQTHVEVPSDIQGNAGKASVFSTSALPDGCDYRTPTLEADEVALLTYTSGTTGKPKGAMNTHGNLAFNAETYVQISALRPGEPVLAIAPLFHITGMVGHIMLGIRVGAPLIITHRFHPSVMLESIRRTRPVFTVGAITALMALADSSDATSEDLSSLRTIYSGGAPIAPSLGDRLEKAYGAYVHNIYGMSETASPTHLVPRGARAPVDPASGALSIGKPIYDTKARIVDEDLNDVQQGEYGEILLTGPQVTTGYWNKPDATRSAFAHEWLKTGDIGFVDADGWFYLVDRKKDMINASGYKVWPREVEDALYTHPAVAEVAVVGVADEYRGETVKAFVTLQNGQHVEPKELIEFCKQNMAAYKYPREVEILNDMPKTATGKILRRQLRTP